jgi:hypothetical protein
MTDMKIEYGEVLALRKGRTLATAVVYPCNGALLTGSRKAGPLAKGSLHGESHARIFGLSLAAVFAACLVLNAASPSTRTCRHSDLDFGATSTGSISAAARGVPAAEGGSHLEPSGAIHSKECATNEGGEEAGYR